MQGLRRVSRTVAEESGGKYPSGPRHIMCRKYEAGYMGAMTKLPIDHFLAIRGKVHICMQ